MGSLLRTKMVITEEIQKFIKLGKEQGSLAVKEINELLPPEILDPGLLDEFMQALEVNGINITESSENKLDPDDANQTILSYLIRMKKTKTKILMKNQ